MSEAKPQDGSTNKRLTAAHYAGDLKPMRNRRGGC
jgi:hypothetical protein